MTNEELRKLLKANKDKAKKRNAPPGMTGNPLQDVKNRIAFKKEQKRKREELEDKRRFGTLDPFEDPEARTDGGAARLGGGHNAEVYMNAMQGEAVYKGSSMGREVGEKNYSEDGNTTRAEDKTLENATFGEVFVNNVKQSFYDTVIGGFGDVAQVLGASLSSTFNPNVTFGEAMLDGNFISNAIHQYADKHAGEYDAKNPEYHLDENGNMTIETFLDPNFWAVEGGKFAPQLAEILLTMGEAAVIKKGVQKELLLWLRKLPQKLLKK